MGTVTLSAAGVGAAQSGTVTTAAGSAAGSIMVTNHSDGAITFNVATAGTDVQTGLSCGPKDYTIITGLASAAKTLTSVKTAHGTSAQSSEKLYIHLAS